MEDKLKELKEQFCKFYCKYSNDKYIRDEEYGYYFYPCEYYQVDEYIRFIRDDIK